MKLNLPELVATPLNRHYEGAYSEEALRWRAVGAVDKAGNIREMLGPRAAGIDSVVEVGCGTGIVLHELRKWGIVRRHCGFDMADPNTHTDPDVAAAEIMLAEYDGATLPLADASVDLVYATHVLEHVTDERGFLAELARVARRWIYVEVPCEITLRSSIPLYQSTLDIGHINAYTPETLLLTLITAGLRPVEIQAFDHSMAVHAFHCSAAKARIKAMIRRSLLKVSPVAASRLLSYHVGVLCGAPERA